MYTHTHVYPIVLLAALSVGSQCLFSGGHDLIVSLKKAAFTICGEGEARLRCHIYMFV